MTEEVAKISSTRFSYRPKDFVLDTLHWIAKKVTDFFRSFFAFFTRVSIFRLATKDTCGAPLLMRMYQCCSRESYFDKKRALKSRDILLSLGMKEYCIQSKDNKDVHYMLFTASSLNEAIENNNGVWKEVIYTDKQEKKKAKIIVPKEGFEEDEKFAELKKNLLAMKWPEKEIPINEKTQKAIVTFEECQTEEAIPTLGSSLVVRCTNMNRLYEMNRRYYAAMLGAGMDVAAINYRGMSIEKSSEKVSEGGVYLDVQAMVDDLLNQHKYDPKKMWVTGECLGAAIAAYVKKEYGETGMNFSFEKPFTSLQAITENQMWPASCFGSFALPRIQSEDPSITSKVEQDRFNSEEKLQTCKEKGKIVYIRPSKDYTVPKGTTEKLRRLYQKISQPNGYFEIINQGPRGTNGHFANLFSNKETLLSAIQIYLRA